MRYATVSIPKGQYRDDDPAMRWDGQRVRIVGKYEELTKHPKDRPYVNVHSTELGSSTLMPKAWLQEGPF